jgi:hypothetical protein
LNWFEEGAQRGQWSEARSVYDRVEHALYQGTALAVPIRRLFFTVIPSDEVAKATEESRDPQFARSQEKPQIPPLAAPLLANRRCSVGMTESEGCVERHD